MNKDQESIYSAKDVEIKSVDRVFQGYFAIDKYTVRYRRFDGSWSTFISREIFERGNASAVIPYDPETGKIVLIEQFRTGALTNSENPWLLEIPAGIVDKGEDPEETAVRELQEETGLKCGKIIHAIDFLTTPGGSTEKIFLYVGKVSSNDAKGLHGLSSESEDIREFTVTLPEALSLIDNGRICNSIAITGIQYLALHLEDIQKKLS